MAQSKRIKTLRELRGYGLGERNPDTLPGAHPKSESADANAVASQRWARLRKQVLAGRFLGAKY
jgi:hypothetical protein